MIINDEKRYVYVANSKTGSSSIHAALGYATGHPEPKYHHEGIRGLIKRYPHIVDYKHVGFVRNVWSKIWSLYYEFRFVRVHQYSQLVRVEKPLFSEFKDFEDFCLNVFDTEWINDIFFAHQIDLLSTDDDNNSYKLIDFVGRFENLQADFDKLCLFVGEKPSILQKCRHGNYKGSYREQYTRKSIDAVGNFYHRDIKVFNHDF